MNNQTYTVEQWLLKLADEFKGIGDINPFCGIWVIADAIEFLGKCIHNDDFSSSDNCREKFKCAISNIPAFDEYKQIDDLYHKLRCGLTHAMRPDSSIKLKAKGSNIITNKEITISFEQLSEDFSKGVQQLIKGEDGLRTDRLSQVYIDVSDENGDSTTGATSSIMNKA